MNRTAQAGDLSNTDGDLVQRTHGYLGKNVRLQRKVIVYSITVGMMSSFVSRLVLS